MVIQDALVEAVQETPAEVDKVMVRAPPLRLMVADVGVRVTG
jgi:hypothetical protein